MSNNINEKYFEMRSEWLEENLAYVLEKTRKEPGLSLDKIAKVIKDILASEEVEFLVKELRSSNYTPPKDSTGDADYLKDVPVKLTNFNK